MTTIDHRILIPAAPDVVWDFISDITRNPQWQVDCFEVIFLTSRRDGPGLRWRYSTPNGNEFVIAVTAWYNGLGYEYYFVDGVPFRENKGRIRLQEIPEGTIVQWTFTYELGGMFGGVRNAMGLSRQINHTIADSLKTLWQQIKETSGERNHEAKSLMREAPDVEARSAYQPRHPSAMEKRGEADDDESQPIPEVTQPMPASAPAVAEPPVNEDDGQAIHVIAEPPVNEEDTRPRRPVAPPTVSSQPAAPIGETDVPASAIPPDLDEEPEFLVDLSRFEPPRDPSDTQPRHAVGETSEPETPEAEPESTAEPTERSPFARPIEQAETAEPTPSAEETEPLTFKPPEVLPDYLPSSELLQAAEAAQEMPEASEAESLSAKADESSETVSAAAIGEVAQPDKSESDIEEPTGEITRTAEREAATEPSGEPVEPPATAHSIPEPDVSETDSKSIWEIFGVPRPSETQETEAAEPVNAPESAPSTGTENEPEPTTPSMSAVNLGTASEAEATPAETVEPVATTLTLEPHEAISLPSMPLRIGLRIVLRRKLVHLRRLQIPDTAD